MIRAVIFDMFETLITHYKSPLYFSREMALDAGLEWEKFYKIWKETEKARTLGKMTFEEVIEKILTENGVYSDQKLKKIVRKRTETKTELFNHLDDEIIPLLTELKKRGMKTGLISNCFDEEADVIEKSVLAPFFDGIYLSCRTGLQKPDPEIFRRCTADFCVKPEECIYCGDGGSGELEAASDLGMHAVQALWYFDGIPEELRSRKLRFTGLEKPLDLLKEGECYDSNEKKRP